MVGYCTFCNEFRILMKKHYELYHPNALRNGVIETQSVYLKRIGL